MSGVGSSPTCADPENFLRGGPNSQKGSDEILTWQKLIIWQFQGGGGSGPPPPPLPPLDPPMLGPHSAHVRQAKFCLWVCQVVSLGVLPFSPHLLIGPSHMSRKFYNLERDVKLNKKIVIFRKMFCLLLNLTENHRSIRLNVPINVA